MTVTRNDAARRYEMPVEGGLAFASYREAPGALIVHHTEAPPQLQGRGVGSALVRGMLDDIRARGLKVSPACSFVRAFIRRHPDYADLVV